MLFYIKKALRLKTFQERETGLEPVFVLNL
nr:MAG TPA: hypothetical protein [Caudoviricetes sp.]